MTNMTDLTNIPAKPLIYADPRKQLSYSSRGSFHSCARKFELDRIGNFTLADGLPARRETPAMAYGSAFGAGLASLLSGASLGRSLVTAIANYRYTDPYPQQYADEKSLFHCLNSLIRFSELELIEITTEWEPFLFNGRPAYEIDFAIQLPSGFYYRGFIDFILQHRVTKQLLVVEVKTDGSYPSKNPQLGEAKYRNSDQGTVYAVVADWLAHKAGTVADVSVCYIVHRTKTNSFEPHTFVKNSETRIRFLDGLVAELSYIDFLIERAKPFPMHGSCTSYNSVCPYYSVCEIPSDYSLVKETSIGDFTYIIPLSELVDTQQTRLNDSAGN